jgi:hypothetical protein
MLPRACVNIYARLVLETSLRYSTSTVSTFILRAGLRFSRVEFPAANAPERMQGGYT